MVEPSAGKKPLRRDAQERRDRLIKAAAACFAERGFNVPLEDIMARADVGRGTFYRNFNDRMSLVFAIFEDAIDRLKLTIDPDVPLAQTITDLVFQGAEAHRLFARMAGDMPLYGDNLATLQALGLKFEAVIEPALEGAYRRGDIDVSVEGRQLHLVLRMVSSLLHFIRDEAASRAQVAEAVKMVLDGLRPK